MNLQTLLSMISNTSSWSISTAIIMVICNLLCIGLGRYAIQVRGLGPSIPALGLKGFGLPELLATTSLGHIIGAGAIIGLNSIKIIN
uniref:Photosystem I reaction center subunit PsaK n=1 Tax=Gracilaria tenuistipitata var. liui TaxID=285951 RepID=PSAK_GRATL|nr:photosystem I subunit X [Gracilaria tenuistipitata var. liui]Q6B8M4.1 RecName: Full=Photosystem I reaction center subunit PsaK; AltName: Full=PSI-K; AltName: Full=Photosystem I subunit X [Gracilaria tenuistipitata var. liui]AAT79761.1 photosystem I reaction center subunit X [Gracilaria tenuistipitata var. liui]